MSVFLWEKAKSRNASKGLRPSSLLLIALENKCKTAEKKADTVLKEKKRLESELEALTKKTHDASGQLVLISQELLKKERSVCRSEGHSWRQGALCVFVFIQGTVNYHQKKPGHCIIEVQPPTFLFCRDAFVGIQFKSGAVNYQRGCPFTGCQELQESSVHM